jgi:radical SAM superfamily enzyme YgiQ (UPF0313 family)
MKNTKKIKVWLISLASSSHLIIVNPLAVATLSAYLRKVFGSQVDLVVRCSQFEPISKIIADIDKEHPEIIGLSLQIGSYKQMEGFMKKIKDIMPGWDKKPRIVFGNVIATFASKILLKNYPDALAVVGEGEYALEEIVRKTLKAGNDFSEIPNLIYIKDGKVVENKRVPFHLDELEIPSFDYMENIVKANGHVWIEASRGCNSRCVFCSRYPVRMTKWVPINTDKVLAVISELNVRFGIRHFRFSDDDFLGTGSEYGMIHAKEIANGIIKKGLDITFDISTQVKSVYSDKDLVIDSINKEEVFKLLQRAGLTQVFLGVESGSCGQLKRFGKPASVDENFKAVNKLHCLGIQVVAGFIVIDYLMSIEELEENILFIEKVGALDPAKRIFISDFLVTLRAQEGSAFPKLLQRNELLRSRNAQHLNYNADYKDAQIGEIASMVEQWRKEDFVSVYILKNRVSKLSLENAVSTEREVLEQFLRKLKVLDYEYLVELTKSTKQNRDMVEVRRKFILKRLCLVEKLQLEISQMVREDNFILHQEIDRFIHDTRHRLAHSESYV